MTSAEIEYVRHRLARAQSAVGEAELLISGGFTMAAVNRMYYACFYAVSALLYSQGYSSSKHSGVVALFDRHFIKTGVLAREMGRFYHDMFDRRQESDYKAYVSLDRADVEAWLDQTRGFVEQSTDWLSRNVEGLA